MYCGRCGVTHRDSCPKERAATECPQCGETKKIPKDDYMCKTCRVASAPKFFLDIPAIRLGNLRQEEINALATMLLKHGVGFSVVPE